MNTNWKLVSKVGIPLAGLFALSACGGGGGGTAASSPTATTVSGTAAKGLVKQAKVLVCRIVNGAPEADASCATGTTGSDGAYSVTLSDGYTGPAMVKVMAGTASMMTDETTGTDIPYNMTMRAVVPAVSGTTTVYVTPYSEMAASAASTTTMDATKIGLSITAVQSLMSTLGIDLSVMPMVDLKDNAANSTMLSNQSNMVKQLGRVAMAAKNSSLLKDPATGVACNVANATPSPQMACAVAAMASAMNSYYVNADATKSTTMLAALNAQNTTSISMPILNATGTISTPMVDMTSAASMQTAMQNAGMALSNAATTVTAMMGGMH